MAFSQALKITRRTLLILITDFQLLPTVQGSKPGKNVQFQENEIRGLCLKFREIFLSQPVLLELETLLEICGEYHDFDSDKTTLRNLWAGGQQSHRTWV